MRGRDCVFCDIIDGYSPAVKVMETGTTLVIVPLCPVTTGHVLFIPRRHVRDAADDAWLTGQVVLDASAYAKRAGQEFNLITSAGESATQSVFHLHVHYVPRSPGDQLMIPWGTLHGEDPKAPHRCRQVVELENKLRAFEDHLA